MTQTNGRSVRDINKQKWESSDFPIVCETCLGDNPYVRMSRDEYGAECKICERPFTTFRWKAGRDGRFKKTEVCQLCSKLKNVCQTCLLDLQYGLPTQVRDAVLGQVDAMPTTQGNKEFYLQNAQTMLDNGVNPTTGMIMSAEGAGGKMAIAHQTLKRMARTTPYYERNKAHICSFWVKGECKRGEECPYRHEMPFDPNDPLAKQNFKDRYYGTNDPVADKMMKRQSSRREVEPPSDPTITTLYIGNISSSSDITEKDLRDVFYQYGEIKRIDLKPRISSAFIEFATREAAELAVLGSLDLTIKDAKLRVLWSRTSDAKKNADLLNPANYEPVPGLPAPLYAPSVFPAGFPAPSSAPVAASSSTPSGSSFPPPGMPSGMPPGFRPPTAAGGAAGFPPAPFSGGAGLPPGFRLPAPGIGLPPGIRAIDPTKAFMTPPPPPRPPGAAAAGAPGAAHTHSDGHLRVHYPSMDPTRSGARAEPSQPSS